ncbi:MAG: mannose-6-phosphate isomerase, class I [Turicibacter sp.]|nr:mannose-6-phosphate isomerase, class I [Turicibacter sp.]
MEPLFLTPVFQERIWGGTALRDEFGYDIPNDKTGECWAISAHPNGMGYIKNGPFKGKSLKELWDHNRELFGNAEGKQFPLLTKILDANADLSVQVHPDDAYANLNENGELGKTECWYIIDAKEGAELIFGHNAKTASDVRKMLEEGQWEAFLRRIKVKKGDFFFVPSGTVHALCEGTLILETQQSSDTTYRLYDYDRVDDAGNPRELHLEKSIDVIHAPHSNAGVKPSAKEIPGGVVTTYVASEFFSVYKYDIDGVAAFSQDQPFLLMSVLSGTGKINEVAIQKGDHFILPAGFGDYTLTGKLELMVSHI